MKKIKRKITKAKRTKVKIKQVKHTSRLMKDIEIFHKKFGRKAPRRPELPSLEDFEFRLHFLQEEIGEMAEAYAAKDLINFADALVDIAYVALGGAYLAGLPFDKLWSEVHRTNMKKKKAKTASDSTRGYSCDVIKPKNWKPPALGVILCTHGLIASPRAIEVIKATYETEAPGGIPQSDIAADGSLF
jgi:predicted HAD superfamily Cof-like phosphohydrolase